MELVLASASPRRAELLAGCGVSFTIHPVEVGELSYAPEIARLPELNAALKADAAGEIFPAKMVLGADTMIIFQGRAIGKPADLAEARQMLREFSGKTHEVVTGMALVCRQQNFRQVWSETSQVTFKTLDETAIGSYLNSVEVLDKAGAYAIQEHGDEIISSYTGELANIIGLPLKKLCRLLEVPDNPSRQ